MIIRKESQLRTAKFCLIAIALVAVPAWIADAQSGLDDFDPKVAWVNPPNPGYNGEVEAIALQADGKIIIGGAFNQIGGEPRTNLARLNPDGSVDRSFDPRNIGFVMAVAVQADGKVVFGGYGFWDGQTPTYIGRVNPDGSADNTFSALADYYIDRLAVQKDGKIVLAGGFTKLGGLPRQGIGRLNPDGSLDSSFVVENVNTVHGMAVQEDGGILMSGAFNMGTFVLVRILRFNSDGSLDTTFISPFLNLPVYSILPQLDGKILIGGAFGRIDNRRCNRVARLLANGAPDLQFDTGPGDEDRDADDTVLTMALQADGKILVGGELTNVGGKQRRGIGRLNADGTFDPSFTTDSDNAVAALAVQGDGKILVVGYFDKMQGQPRNKIGRIIPTVHPPRLASVVRLNDGALQFSFANPDRALFNVVASTDAALPVALWNLLGTPVSIGNGIYQFTDLAAPAFARRFYQLRTP